MPARPRSCSRSYPPPGQRRTIHIDLLRVRLDQAIQATVVLELIGKEDAPGVKEGGVLEHVTRELTVEALPTEIPDTIEHDVSEIQIGDTLTVEAIILSELRVQNAIRQTLKNEREQLLKAAYIETLRNRAKVENDLAEQIVKGQLSPPAAK